MARIRAYTVEDMERLILWRFTPAQARHMAFLRWAYLCGRLGEWPAPPGQKVRCLERPA